MTINLELKPCPFCGGEPNLTHDDYVHDDLRPMLVVECKSCSAWVRAEDWNRRAQAQAAPEAEPVAWKMFDGEGGYDYTDDEETAEKWREYLGEKYNSWLDPLYTAPQHDAELVELLEAIAAAARGRESGYAARMHGDVVNGRCADSLVELLPRIDAKLATLRHV